MWSPVAGGLLGPPAYHLPDGVRNPRRRAFRSAAVNPTPLPEKIEPMNSNNERKMIIAILSEISVLYVIKNQSFPLT
jgi:hypothetical protein